MWRRRLISFSVDELAPYDAAELIPQKGDAAMALRVLQRAREILPRLSSPIDAPGRGAAGGGGQPGNQGRADVSADSRRGLRPQECAAAV